VQDGINYDGTKSWEDVEADFPIIEISPRFSSDKVITSIGGMNMSMIFLANFQILSTFFSLEVKRFTQVVGPKDYHAREKAKKRGQQGKVFSADSTNVNFSS